MILSDTRNTEFSCSLLLGVAKFRRLVQILHDDYARLMFNFVARHEVQRVNMRIVGRLLNRSFVIKLTSRFAIQIFLSSRLTFAGQT